MPPAWVGFNPGGKGRFPNLHKHRDDNFAAALKAKHCKSFES
jgi:hypothetical protein